MAASPWFEYQQSSEPPAVTLVRRGKEVSLKTANEQSIVSLRLLGLLKSLSDDK